MAVRNQLPASAVWLGNGNDAGLAWVAFNPFGEILPALHNP